MRGAFARALVAAWMIIFWADIDWVTGKLVLYSEEIVGRPGDTVILRCELRNISGVVKWIRNNEELRVEVAEHSGRLDPGVNETSGHYYLRISDLRLDDDGVWHCQELKDYEALIFTSRPIRIIVIVAPKKAALVFEDKVLPEEATFTIKEKMSVTWHCTVDNVNPAPEQIHWFLDDENITSSENRIVSEFSELQHLYSSKSSLTLQVTRRHHRKWLECRVYHMALDAEFLTARINFNILYIPTFVISRLPDFGYPIYEGLEVALKCEVNANPPSDPIWLKDDDASPPFKQSQDGFINFTSIERSHTGWYRCSTRHQFGDFASFGYFLNVRSDGAEIVHQPPPQVQVGLGGTVLLECAADGKPPPSYCWARVKDGGRLESLGMEQNLLLDRILYTDAGVYKCIAQNNLGWEEKRADSRHVEVVVTGRPQVEAVNRTLMAFVGQSSSFSVQFCANPMPHRTHWITSNRVINPGDVFDRFVAHHITPTGTANCFQATLDILEVHVEDAGEFLFIAKNSKGIDDAVVLLNITQASFSVSAAAVWLRSLAYLVCAFTAASVLWRMVVTS